jgi:hypothetical protein
MTPVPTGSHCTCPTSILQGGLRVLRGFLLPDELAAVDDHEAAVGQPRVEKLGIREQNGAVVAAVDDRDRRFDLRQQLGELGQSPS